MQPCGCRGLDVGTAQRTRGIGGAAPEAGLWPLRQRLPGALVAPRPRQPKVYQHPGGCMVAWNR